MANHTDRVPGYVTTASALLGIVSFGGLAITAAVIYMSLTAEGMGLLIVPVALFVGLLALSSAVGCAMVIPKLLKGSHRGTATLFAALALVPTACATLLLFSSLTGKLENSTAGIGDYLLAALGPLLAGSAIGTIALLWVPTARSRSRKTEIPRPTK